MKAIETTYKGYKFRSRLEARWAVFFDALDIQWEYEKEGYDLGDAGWYLPDFWLPQFQMWAEVKPTVVSDLEITKCIKLSNHTGYPCLVLNGTPTNKAYLAFHGTTMIDHILSTEFLHEGRFYSGCGCDCALTGKDGCGYCNWSHEMNMAVSKARSVRFEHGEKPHF